MNVSRTTGTFEKIIAIVVLLVVAWLMVQLAIFLGRVVGAILNVLIVVAIFGLIAYGIWYLFFGRRG